MARDLKVMFVRDAIPVNKVSLISRDPPTLRLYGGDFTNASMVIINSIETTDFVVAAPGAIDVVLPEDLQGLPHNIRSIDVLAETFTSTVTSTLDPRWPPYPAWSQGLHRLVQQFVKVLLTTPGTNLLRRDEGGGLQQLVGVTVADQIHHRELSAGVMLAVKRTVQQIKTRTPPRLPKEEKLRDVRVDYVQFQPTAAVADVRLVLTNETDQIALANLGLNSFPTRLTPSQLIASGGASAALVAAVQAEEESHPGRVNQATGGGSRQ